MPDVVPRPKPAKRIKASREDWRYINAELGTTCAGCGAKMSDPIPHDRPWQAWFSRHHLVPKGQGGDDVVENLVLLCGHGTVGCHGKLELRIRDHWKIRRAIRLGTYVDTTAKMRYVREKKSQDWLDRMYPKQGGTPDGPS